jgi:hypothetical protein
MKTPIGLLAACVMGTMFAVGAFAADTTPAAPAAAPAAATQPAKDTAAKPAAATKRAEYCKEHKEECAKRAAERHEMWCKKHANSPKCKTEEKKDEPAKK